MKLDQETFVKHQFWFLLGGYFLVWLTAILWMKFTYPDVIAQLQDNYKKAGDGVKTALSSGPVNQTTFLPPWKQEAKEFNDHKSVIWEAAWKSQAEMYDWPAELAKKYDMTTPQAPLSSDDRNEYKDKLYLNQVDYWRTNAPKFLSPVELKDGFDNVFKPMTKRDWKETPTREEIWLAQEDFWVKRELLIDVYRAMAWQALMVPVDIDEKKEPMPKGVEARYRFRNKNWEITLNIRKGKSGPVIGGDSTIKNIRPNRHPQPLTSAKGKGIWFNIAQDNVQTTFEVRGEPVSWNETKNFSEEDYPDPISGIHWEKEYIKEHPIVVSQGFDQTNCPIRRINAIELPKQDCRTFIWPLQPNNLLAQLDALPEDSDPNKAAGGAGDAGTGGAGASGGLGGSGAMMMQMMRPGGMGGAAARKGNTTPNNEIERDRYLQPASEDKKANPPSRHLPLAIQLIVEQSHMHDIMLALANSRLRFQITQVEFKHEKNYTPQSEDDKDKKDGAGGDGPKVFTGGMPAMPAGGSGSGGPRMQMQMMMRMQTQMRGGGGAMPPGGPMGGSGAMRPSGAMGGSGAMPAMGKGGGGSGSMAMMMRPPGTPGMMGTGQMKGSFMSAPGTMRTGTMPTMGGADPNQAASDQSDDNLVEVTIYGIATLYRAPDAPQTTEQSSQPVAPAAQPGQPPAASAAPQAASGQPSGGASPPPPTATQSNPASPPPNTTQPQPSDGASPPPAPKQPDKTVDQQKAPPSPPTGNKK